MFNKISTLYFCLVICLTFVKKCFVILKVVYSAKNLLTNVIGTGNILNFISNFSLFRATFKQLLCFLGSNFLVLASNFLRFYEHNQAMPKHEYMIYHNYSNKRRGAYYNFGAFIAKKNITFNPKSKKLTIKFICLLIKYKYNQSRHIVSRVHKTTRPLPKFRAAKLTQQIASSSEASP